jgi:S13-like protein
MTAVPTLTAQQRHDALRQAIAARAARKQLLKAVAQGQESIPAVLDRAKTDTIVGRTKVTALLNSQPGYGPAKVTALMQRTGIASSRRIAGLGSVNARRCVTHCYETLTNRRRADALGGALADLEHFLALLWSLLHRADHQSPVSTDRGAIGESGTTRAGGDLVRPW